MNGKLFISLCVIGCGVVVASFIAGTTSAQTEGGAANVAGAADVQYPIAELENCKDQADCKTYCDIPAHMEVCVAYAEKNNLMSKDDIGMAKKFLAAGAKGPGGCTTKESCETYCDNISRINECVSFAKKTGILPPEQLKEAEQVQAAIAKGVEPPPCKNKKECDVYCDEPSHMKICVAFGEAAGFLQGKELEDAKKMMAAIDKGVTPPPCKGKDACDTYCSEPEHMEACMTFAQAAGLMSPEEQKDSEKVLQAIKKGAKPPACKGKEECDKYCAQEEHLKECMDFAIAAGFMSEKDAEMARKTGGKGPGGCTGKDTCDAFCQNPENQQTCFNFAKDNGLISEEDLQKMQEGQKRFQESFQNMPPQVLTCLQNSIGSDMLEKFKSGQVMPSKDVGEKMGQCFSQMGGPSGQGTGPGGQMMPSGQQGQSFGLQNISPEVSDCIKNLIGNEEFEKLRSSQGPPSPDIGDKIRGCFFKTQNMPTEVSDCIKNIIGNDAFEKLKSGQMAPLPETGDRVQECFGKTGSPPSTQGPIQGTMQDPAGAGGAVLEDMPPEYQKMIVNQLPQQALDCLRSSVGSEVVDKIRSGEAMSVEGFGAKLQSCMGSFMPQGQPGQMPSGSPIPGTMMTPPLPGSYPQPPSGSSPPPTGPYQPPTSGPYPPQPGTGGAQQPLEPQPQQPYTQPQEQYAPQPGTIMPPQPEPMPTTAPTTPSLQNQELFGALIESFRRAFGL